MLLIKREPRPVGEVIRDLIQRGLILTNNGKRYER